MGYVNCQKKRAVALVFAWLIPGAGHYYCGYRWQGLSLLFLLSMLYMAGLFLSDFRNISLQEPLFLIGYFAIGGFTSLALLISAQLPEIPHWYLWGYHLGCLYTTVAALLNAVIVIQLYSLTSPKLE